MGAEPDAWSEIAYISIAESAASAGVEYLYHSLTETIDIDLGERGGESMPTLAGGRVWKQTPTADTTVTLEMYPVFAGTTVATSSAGMGVFDLLNSGAGMVASQAIMANTGIPLDTADIARPKYRLCITWTDDAVFAGGTAATAASTNALRFVMAEATCISVKPSMTDGILKFTVAFKAAPYDKSGTANIKMYSGDDTALGVLAAYTSLTTKW